MDEENGRSASAVARWNEPGREVAGRRADHRLFERQAEIGRREDGRPRLREACVDSIRHCEPIGGEGDRRGGSGGHAGTKPDASHGR